MICQGYFTSSCKEADIPSDNPRIWALWPDSRALAFLCCIRGAVTEPKVQLDQLALATIPGRQTETRAAGEGFAYVYLMLAYFKSLCERAV